MMRRLFFELRYLLGRPRWDTGITPPELIEHLETHPPGRALDVGCGSGTNAIEMARRGWQVIGVDFSSLAVRRARRKARAASLPLEFQRQDATRLEGVRGPFDLILDIGCFHSLSPSDRGRYVGAVAQRLKPGGTLLLYAMVEGPPGGPGHGLDETSLAQILSPRLEMERAVRGEDHGRISAWFTFHRRDAA